MASNEQPYNLRHRPQKVCHTSHSVQASTAPFNESAPPQSSYNDHIEQPASAIDPKDQPHQRKSPKKQLTRRIQELEGKNVSQAQRIESFSTQLHRKEEQVRAANNKNQNLHQQLDVYHQQLTEANNRLAELETQRLANPYKVSDTSIQSQWSNLGYSIRSLAITLSNTKADPTSEPLVLDRVCEHWGVDFVPKDENGIGWYLQALFWQWIQWSIFSARDEIWAGEAEQLLIKLKDRIGFEDPSRVSELAPWFSEGANWVINMTDDQSLNGKVEFIANDMLWKLASCYPELNGQQEARDNVFTELKEILTASVQLQRVMLSSRAFFTIEFPETHRGKRIDHWEDGLVEMVEDDDEEEGVDSIMVAISPWVIKRGNADGLQHDKQLKLIKATVFCASVDKGKGSQNDVPDEIMHDAIKEETDELQA